MSSIPPLFAGLVDDAAVFPPGNAPLPDAVAAHREHRAAWYAELIGPLMVPASRLEDVTSKDPPIVGLIGDTGLAGLDTALSRAEALDCPVPVRQVEIAVARRGEDPVPGLRDLLAWSSGRPLDVYAEIPLTWGCVAALDVLAQAPTDAESVTPAGTGRRIVPKFRTGGAAAELFPSPEDLASVIVACAERRLAFKLTAGLHHAVRHIDNATDNATGFVHHGFLNVLAGARAAAAGQRVGAVADLLRLTEPEPLVRQVRAGLDSDRPLWVGFGSCSVTEPLDDLVTFGLIGRPRGIDPRPDPDTLGKETR